MQQICEQLCTIHKTCKLIFTICDVTLYPSTQSGAKKRDFYNLFLNLQTNKKTDSISYADVRMAGNLLLCTTVAIVNIQITV